MIKVLFFIPGLSEGGAEKVLCNLVNNMDQSKFDITVQTIEKYEHKKYLVPGIHYKSIFSSKRKLIKKISFLWYRFCTEFKLTYPQYIKDDYDIEVAYLECGATKVMAASTNKDAVKLAWVHCDLIKKGITGKKVASFYSKYDYAVCVSQDVKKSFDELFGEYVPSTVLRNVIDEEEIYQKSKEKIEWKTEPKTKKFLAVGRLSEEKNFEYLINTCARLKSEGYLFDLKILGDGPLHSHLQQLIDEKGLNSEVELKGFLNNPYPWIANADYILCSSKYEGMSTVIQEALVLGKIIITTSCAGMKELLGESEYGLIVDDSSDGLFNGIKRMMDDKKKEDTYCEKVKKCNEELKKKNMVNKTQTFLENLISKKEEKYGR